MSKTKNKSKQTSTKSAVQAIRTMAKRTFASAVKNAATPSEALRNLDIYENGRNRAALRERADAEGYAFSN